jgi:hypothetical protein
MNLTELFTAAATGTAVLTAADGTPARFTPDTVARLWAAAADDRTRMGLYLLPEPAAMTVTAEHGTPAGQDQDDADPWIVELGTILRYRFTEPDGVTRLCERRGCYRPPVAGGIYTSVCEDHLDTVLNGWGTDGDPTATDTDREAAAAASRTRRLDAWDAQLQEEQDELALRRGRLDAARNRRP